MKTYTKEQIKKYLESQDSLGDIHYNLDRIDEFIKEEVEKDDEDWNAEEEEEEIRKFKMSGNDMKNY